MGVDPPAADHLIAVIQPANTSSITLAERLGFTYNRHDVTPAARTCRSTDSTARRPEHIDTPATRPLRRCE